MTKIFISYRRDESSHQADRLHSELKRYVLHPEQDIFLDVEGIPVGVDFVEYLDAKVAQSDVLLALIGPNWLDARNQETGQRRLDDENDFVRVEIGSALRRGISVAPVLLDGAFLPSALDLPDELRLLSRRQGVELRRMTFAVDVMRLAMGLGLQERAPSLPKQMSAPTFAPPDVGNIDRKEGQGVDAFEGWTFKKFVATFKEFGIDPGIILGPRLANAPDAEKILRMREAAKAFDSTVVALEQKGLAELKVIASELGAVVDVGRVRLPEKQVEIFATQISVTKTLWDYAAKNRPA